MKLNPLSFVVPALIGKDNHVYHSSSNIAQWALPAAEYEPPPFESGNKAFTSTLYVSNLMYTFADLRKMVNTHEEIFNQDISASELRKVDKEGGLFAFERPELIDTRNSAAKPIPAAKMNNPVTAAAVLEFLKLNKENIGQDDKGNLKFVKNNSIPNPTLDLMISNLSAVGGEFDADIVEFDDEFASSTLVYSVVANRKNKRVTVVFRGSVTPKDWFVDFTGFKKTPEIIDNFTTTSPKIHKGFSNYLLNPHKVQNYKSKMEQIIKVLKDVYEYKDEAGRDYSDYELYITGHSLGGALTQLSAFVLAGLDLDFLPKTNPINAISFASPIVGNSDFLEEYEKLEKDNKLRHIRVSNHNDVVPFQVPGYRQTGVNFHVKEGEEMEVKYLNPKTLITQLRLPATLTSHSLQGETNYYPRLYAKDESGSYLNGEVLDKSIEEIYDDYAGIEGFAGTDAAYPNRLESTAQAIGIGLLLAFLIQNFQFLGSALVIAFFANLESS